MKFQECFICVVFMKDCYTPHLLQTWMIIFSFDSSDKQKHRQFYCWKAIRPKENNILWYSKRIKNQILLRVKYLKQNPANPTSANKLRYTASRNYTNGLIKSKKYIFYNRKFDSKMKQPGRFYRELNNLSGRNETKDEVRIIGPDHNVVVQEDNPADFFFQRIASQGERASRSISALSVEEFQSERTLNSIYLYPTSVDEIHRSIADLKIDKASGIDELSAEVLKISALSIVPYLKVYKSNL